MDPDAEKGHLVTEALRKEPFVRTDAEILAPLPPTNGQQRSSSTVLRALQRVEDALSAFNLEKRGIQRVEPHETQPLTKESYFQVFILWASINLVAGNVALGMLGPAVFYLSFTDAALCAVFGSIAGSLPVAYIATLGPISGNRSLVFARYTMGWWPSKLIVILNIIILLGYNMINCVITGQILSAVSPNGSLTVVVGIIIVAVVTLVVTTFGIKVFHTYERYAVIPTLIVTCILYGESVQRFDLTTPSSGDPSTVIGSRISFFSLCFAAAITYSGLSADYFVYYSPQTRRLPVFMLSLLGLSVSFTFAEILGIGLASGIPTTPSYADAFEVSQGALLVAGFAPLHRFGSFCAVLTALGIIANVIPSTYSSGIDFQLLTSKAQLVPRFVWNLLGVLVFGICALGARQNLINATTNFLALMGYWVSIWIAIVLEEQLLFQRNRGWDWEAWDCQEKLPIGLAALAAFLIGWAGAILCMAQVWYVGPIARLVGEFGADLGNYVGFAWALLVYPPLRFLELKKFNR